MVSKELTGAVVFSPSTPLLYTFILLNLPLNPISSLGSSLNAIRLYISSFNRHFAISPISQLLLSLL